MSWNQPHAARSVGSVPAAANTLPGPKAARNGLTLAFLTPRNSLRGLAHTAGDRGRLVSLNVSVRRAAGPGARRVRTTPGLLIGVTVGLVVLGLASAAVGLVAVQHRSDRVSDVRTVSGPLSVHALDIYRSLSDADASAATAFLANGTETPALRKRYLDDIARAGSALSLALRATDNESDPDSRSEARLRLLVIQLPVYTGLIETARAHQRQRLTLGAAYLREASGLLRGTLLPAAQDLFTVETGRLAGSQRGGADFPALVLVLGLAMLGCLLGAQAFLTRRTNRLINPGLAVATLATVASLSWVTVAFAAAGGHLDSGRRAGSAQFTLLAEARVVALQARADESLTLIARGDGAANERHFVSLLTRLIGKDGGSGLLGDARTRSASAGDRAAVGDAAALAKTWLARHRELRTLDDMGQYSPAVARALSTAPGSLSVAFEQLDAALGEVIDTTGRRFDGQADAAAGNLTSAQAGLVLPGLVVLIATVLGTRNRIGEYR